MFPSTFWGSDLWVKKARKWADSSRENCDTPTFPFHILTSLLYSRKQAFLPAKLPSSLHYAFSKAPGWISVSSPGNKSHHIIAILLFSWDRRPGVHLPNPLPKHKTWLPFQISSGFWTVEKGMVEVWEARLQTQAWRAEDPRRLTPHVGACVRVWRVAPLPNWRKPYCHFRRFSFPRH